MTHTSTEKPELPEALRLAEMLTSGSAMIPEIDLPEAAAELRRLHARVQELEASQAQRVASNEQLIKAIERLAYAVGESQSLFLAMLDEQKPASVIQEQIERNRVSIRVACGITQEKQG